MQAMSSYQGQTNEQLEQIIKKKNGKIEILKKRALNGFQVEYASSYNSVKEEPTKGEIDVEGMAISNLKRIVKEVLSNRNDQYQKGVTFSLHNDCGRLYKCGNMKFERHAPKSTFVLKFNSMKDPCNTCFSINFPNLNEPSESKASDVALKMEEIANERAEVALQKYSQMKNNQAIEKPTWHDFLINYLGTSLDEKVDPDYINLCREKRIQGKEKKEHAKIEKLAKENLKQFIEEGNLDDVFVRAILTPDFSFVLNSKAKLKKNTHDFERLNRIYSFELATSKVLGYCPETKHLFQVRRGVREIPNTTDDLNDRVVLLMLKYIRIVAEFALHDSIDTYVGIGQQRYEILSRMKNHLDKMDEKKLAKQYRRERMKIEAKNALKTASTEKMQPKKNEEVPEKPNDKPFVSPQQTSCIIS